MAARLSVVAFGAVIVQVAVDRSGFVRVIVAVAPLVGPTKFERTTESSVASPLLMLLPATVVPTEPQLAPVAVKVAPFSNPAPLSVRLGDVGVHPFAPVRFGSSVMDVWKCPPSVLMMDSV